MRVKGVGMMTALAIKLWAGGPDVCTRGGTAIVLTVLASASRSPASRRLAFFGLGLPFVSCGECTSPRNKERNTNRNARSD
jgi:hypothetical protein